MKKRKQWPWIIGCLAIIVLDVFLLTTLQPSLFEIAKASYLGFMGLLGVIASALMAFAIGIMIAIQRIIVV